MNSTFLGKIKLLLVFPALSFFFGNVVAVTALQSKRAFFESKQALPQLEDAVRMLNVDAVKRLISQNKALVNSEEIDPLTLSVVRINRQDKAQAQLELLDFLLNVDGIDVNRIGRGAIRQNTLDVAIKGIQLGKNEGTRNRYRVMAKKLLDHGAVLSALADNTIAQSLVKELSDATPTDTHDQASTPSQGAQDTAVVLSQYGQHLDFLLKKESEEAEQLNNFDGEIHFKRERIKSLENKIALIKEQLS